MRPTIRRGPDGVYGDAWRQQVGAREGSGLGVQSPVFHLTQPSPAGHRPMALALGGSLTIDPPERKRLPSSPFGCTHTVVRTRHTIGSRPAFDV